MAAEPPAPSKSLLTRKLGPLPTWGWMGVGLGGVLVWRYVAGRKAAASGSSSSGTTTITSGYKLPSNIPPQFTNVDERNFSNIGNVNSGNTTTNNGLPAAPAVAPVPAPAAPDGHYVTVVQYRRGDEKRHGIPSSPWGIAELEFGNARLWPGIWNDPHNASLKEKRGDPQKLQGGDQVWVPNSPPNGGNDIDTATRDSNGNIIRGSDGNGFTFHSTQGQRDRDAQRSGRGHRG